MSIIDAAFLRKRTVWMMLVLLFVSGWITFKHIPRESTPDIALPLLYISVSQQGISPNNADKLLIEPVAKELEGLGGLKEINTTGSQGHGSLMLEFQAGTDIDRALADVRERVNKAKSQLPADADEPTVSEINMALFPVLVISLSGNVDERVLTQVARQLRDQLESIPEILQVDITGSREEMLEFTLPPDVMENYGLELETLLRSFQRNHRVVSSGGIDTGVGNYTIQVPGLLENVTDALNLPVAATPTSSLLLRDVGNVERTFKDPINRARNNGLPSITLLVKKRLGANIISAIDQARDIINHTSEQWPEGIYVTYSQDQSRNIKETLSDLTNNVAMATLLVMIVILASLGLRSALLVGISIPGSFLTAILLLGSLGYTLNMVVLFSLILAVGMLVDGAIVVTEYAERRLHEGADRNTAFLEAARRMAWPITASTATTLAAFMPLLFWPGVTGEFMKYLPITLLSTLSASLIMAMIALPVVGSNLGRAQVNNASHKSSSDSLNENSWLTRLYLRVLHRSLAHPVIVLSLAIGMLLSSFFLYGAFGSGVEFFPETDADAIAVTVRGRGDLSLSEKDHLVQNVETLLLRTPGLKTVNTQVVSGQTQQETPEDTIGIIQAELKNWYERAHADKIVAQLRHSIGEFPGLIVEIDKRKDGPAQGFAIQLMLLSQNLDTLAQTTQRLTDFLKQDERLREVRSSLPAPGIEWHYIIDRNLAARYGADVANIGSMIQMATNGVNAGEYRPEDTDEAIDIIVRYPKTYRNLETLATMRVATDQGLIPLTHFVKRQAVPKVNQISRQNGYYLYKVEANPAEGQITNTVLTELLPEIKSRLPEGVFLKLGGDLEQQEESAQFLKTAFSAALFIMAIILVTQFNSFYQAALILSAVIFSTAGVLLGLLIKGEPFGIVMSGVGVIALAGIVVNNNIVLIDTYNTLILEGLPPREAAIETGRQRLRPVLLTTVTTILGLIPMVMQINIAVLEQTISFSPPSAQWWTQLSSAIAGGLTFATLLTLIVTPCLLVLKDQRKHVRAVSVITG